MLTWKKFFFGPISYKGLDRKLRYRSVVVEEDQQDGEGTQKEKDETDGANVHQKDDDKSADGEEDTKQHAEGNEFREDGLDWDHRGLLNKKKRKKSNKLN